jgi:LysR family transcriptional regulator, nitrogen assimilation regulatory protein
MAMTLVQLAQFVAVAKAGSFSAAARQLGVAQSAVSQAIAALERDLDAKLLDRTSRNCRLTPLGEQFLADAQRIVRDAEDTRQRIRRAGRSGEGSLVLGLTGGLSGLLTERLLGYVKAEAPGLDLAVVEGSVGRLRELLLEDRIDCAITYDVTDDDPQLRGRFVAWEPMHLVAHPDTMSRLLQPGPVDLRQIARFPLFLPSLAREHGAGRLLLREAEKEGVTLDIRYELQSTSLIRRLLIQDRLAAVIGVGSIVDEVAAGALAARVVELPAFTRAVCVAARASRQRGPADARLLQGVQQIAADFLLPCRLWRSTRGDYAPPDYELFRRLR